MMATSERVLARPRCAPALRLYLNTSLRRSTLWKSDDMNFAVIFLLLAATMLVAARRDARPTYVLFGIAIVLTIALYFHHATGRLPLSF